MNDVDTTWKVLPDKVYNWVKWLVLIVLPAIGTLYFALAGIWDLPNAERVLGTIVAFQTFLGVILGISNNAYKNSDAKYDGHIRVTDTPDKTIVAVEGKDPDKLIDKDEVLLKVTK